MYRCTHGVHILSSFGLGQISISLCNQLLSLQAEIAESLVQFEMPDRAEQAAIKLREIQDSIPVPERVWALRNVGSTSALGGPQGRARARKLLDQAIVLKRDLVGGMQHPGPQIIPHLGSVHLLSYDSNQAKWLNRGTSYLKPSGTVTRLS